MEYNDLNDEQKATVDQRVESEYVNSDRDPLKELRAGAEAGTNPESHLYDVSDDSEIAALQAQTQKVTQRGRSAAPQRPKAERWYLSPGQKPMGDPEQYRHIGGATPIEAQPEPTKGADGKWRTAFGDKVRVTDEDGNTSWEDTNGQAIEKPKSMQMMEAMNRGYSPNQGTANSWEDAIARQKADAAQKTQDMLNRRSEFINKSAKEKSQIINQKRFNAADAGRLALEGLNAGNGSVKYSPTTGKSYRVYKIKGSTIDKVTGEAEKMGRQSLLDSVCAYVEVDKDGNPVGEANFYMNIRKRNGDGQKDSILHRPLRADEIIGQWADSYQKAYGVSQDEARAAAVNNFKFNGQSLNPFSWKVPLTPQQESEHKERIAQMRADASQNVAQINAQGRVDVAQTNAKSREEVAKFNAEAKKQIAEITARHKEAQSVNGKITGSDLAALYKVANDPLADDTVKSSALEMAEFLTDKLMNAGKAGVKGGDNTKSETIEDAWPGYSAERVAELKRRGYVWDETSGKPVKKSK